MRRAFLILLMWLIPAQAVWAASHLLHDHSPAMAGHGHHQEHSHHLDGDPGLHGDAPTHGDDGGHHHGNHSHAAFAFLVTRIAIDLADTRATESPPARPASYTSHIPLLPDPPPAVRI